MSLSCTLIHKKNEPPRQPLWANARLRRWLPTLTWPDGDRSRWSTAFGLGWLSRQPIRQTSVKPAPPTTAQIPGLGLIICAEFVLSNAPSPRLCAATQPKKFQIEFGWCGHHASTTHNSTKSRPCPNNLCWICAVEYTKSQNLCCHCLLYTSPSPRD